RLIRKSKNMSMKELGKILGLSESTISLYENGLRQPDYDTLKKISDYFNVSLDYLLDNENKKTSPTPKEVELNEIANNDPLKAEMLDVYTKLNLKNREKALDFLRYLASNKDNQEK
ncbi:MAG: helix-turn-helix transcriptional regulator, partial [Oscillospiraceae bacterium]